MKLDQDGGHIVAKTAKDKAKELVTEAKAAYPNGVPADSPYKALTHDQCLSEAARLDMRFGALMDEPDLRLVLEVLRVKLTRGDIKPPELPPPVPMQPAVPVKVRGLRPSESNTWIARCSVERPPNIAINGQMTRIRNGAIIELRHYGEVAVQGLVDQGIKLIPIEEAALEE